MLTTTPGRPRRRLFSRLLGDTSGVALLEFAYAMPVVMAVGLYGVETASLALANLRVSQAALTLADNASRVGIDNLATQQLREVDLNDIFEQVRIQNRNWELTTRGRITLSSLEESSGKQVIHWQRCIGLRSGLNYDSSYGTTDPADGTDTQPANAGTVVSGGMGKPSAKVTAPPGSGVMFVEINYEYNPVVSDRWLPTGTTRLHYVASFIVRDPRDFTQIFNPSPQVAPGDKMTCNRYTA